MLRRSRPAIWAGEHHFSPSDFPSGVSREAAPGAINLKIVPLNPFAISALIKGQLSWCSCQAPSVLLIDIMLVALDPCGEISAGKLNRQEVKGDWAGVWGGGRIQGPTAAAPPPQAPRPLGKPYSGFPPASPGPTPCPALLNCSKIHTT